jgi:thioredoxin-related protein
MKSIIGLMILFPAIINAQGTGDSSGLGEQGIRFKQDISWQQVLTKAKAEHKHVFVDCYATWCSPCKEMDMHVYSDKELGEFFNNKFISIKLQMDSTKYDSKDIMKHYTDAHRIGERYKINGYPTYLFFNPDGRIIYKDLGSKGLDEFLAMGTMVVDPFKDYYSLLEQFRTGKKDFEVMQSLARIGIKIGDSITAQQVANEYIHMINGENLLTKENIEFVGEFTRSSKDRGFLWFYDSAGRIDKVMEDDTYAEQFVQAIIYKEIVAPELNKIKGSTAFIPKWDSLQAVISEKYSSFYADRVIIGARATWGFDHNDLHAYTNNLVLFQERFGSKSNHDFNASWVLNNYAWAIFLYSNEEDELKKALAWSSRAVMITPSPTWMDTYANILYKLGRQEEALLWEQVAAKLSPNDKGIQDTLSKMKKGLSTTNSQ